MEEKLVFISTNFSMKRYDDSQFMSINMMAISDRPNRNKSRFLLDAMIESIPTVYNKPIMAKWNWRTGDVEEHNVEMAFDEDGEVYFDYTTGESESPAGVIPEGANVYISEIDGENWLVIDGALLWVNYSKQITDLIEKQKTKKVSVEITVKDSYMEGDTKVITSFVFEGITILGKDKNGNPIREGIAGANLVLSEDERKEEIATFLEKMTFAIEENNKKDILSEHIGGEYSTVKISASLLRDKLNSALSSYRYGDDNEYRMYWVSDVIVGESVALVYDEVGGGLYAMDYAFSEDGAVVVNTETKRVAEQVYIFISKSEVGTGEAIALDKSEDAVSSDAWGEVSKTELRNTVLKAKNYRSLVKSVYLDVREGWETSPSANLRYPVMQHKGGKLVYNAGGLLAAQQRGVQNDPAVASKAKSIRKKLGLLEPEKRESMKAFIEDAKEAGFVLVGKSSGKLNFAKENVLDETKDFETSIYSVDVSVASEKEFSVDELKEITFKKTEDAPAEEKAAEEKPAEVDVKETAEFKELFSSYEAIKAELDEKNAEVEKIKFSELEKETDAILAKFSEIFSEEEITEIKTMRTDGKFSCTEDFSREIAYRKFVKDSNENKDDEGDSLKFSINKTNPDKKSKDPLDDI